MDAIRTPLVSLQHRKQFQIRDGRERKWAFVNEDTPRQFKD